MNYFMLIRLILIPFFFSHEYYEYYKHQSTIIKKSEYLTSLQINILKEWDIIIPIDKKCINIYIKSPIGWELEKSYVVYNEKDKIDGFIESNVDYQVLFYKNNTSLYFYSTVGTALTSEILIDLVAKIRKEFNYSMHEIIHGNRSNSSLESYSNKSNEKISTNKIPKSVLAKFEVLSQHFNSIFDEFH